MVGRQHHEERILPQRNGVQVVLDGVDEETAVSVAAPHGLFQCIFVVDADQLQVDAWMLCEEALRDTGEPLDGGARERRYAHDAAFEVLERISSWRSLLHTFCTQGSRSAPSEVRCAPP